MNQYRVSEAKNIRDRIETILSSKDADRGQLAAVYERMMGAESFLPKKPIGAKRSIADNLRKNVSDSCGSCVSRKAMNSYIDTAKNHLGQYHRSLIEWLNVHAPEKPKSVHDLKPTI